MAHMAMGLGEVRLDMSGLPEVPLEHGWLGDRTWQRGNRNRPSRQAAPAKFYSPVRNHLGGTPRRGQSQSPTRSAATPEGMRIGGNVFVFALTGRPHQFFLHLCWPKVLHDDLALAQGEGGAGSTCSKHAWHDASSGGHGGSHLSCMAACFT